MTTNKTEEKELKHIVIVGGGFAGFLLSKRIDHTKYSVTLVDRKNFHGFPPLFYQIASSGLEPAAICFPFRKELRKLRHVRFHMGEALSVDTQKQELVTNTGKIHYDYLVLATGTTNNFFNMPTGQIMGFKLITGNVTQPCLMGFNKSRHYNIRRNFTYAHKKKLHQRDVDSRYLSREP